LKNTFEKHLTLYYQTHTYSAFQTTFCLKNIKLMFFFFNDSNVLILKI
jgi:hypothetical protein